MDGLRRSLQNDLTHEDQTLCHRDVDRCPCVSCVREAGLIPARSLRAGEESMDALLEPIHAPTLQRERGQSLSLKDRRSVRARRRAVCRHLKAANRGSHRRGRCSAGNEASHQHRYRQKPEQPAAHENPPRGRIYREPETGSTLGCGRKRRQPSTSHLIGEVHEDGRDLISRAEFKEVHTIGPRPPRVTGWPEVELPRCSHLFTAIGVPHVD